MSQLSIDGTQYDLLTQVESRLHARISLFDRGNCFICDGPVPPDAYFPQGLLACTIAVGDGVFNDSNYDGGAANVLTEDCDLIVTLFLRSKLDQPPRAKVALLDEERGLLTKLKPAVLQALLVDDPAAEILAPWLPMKSGRPFLRGALIPRRSQGPREIPGLDWLGLSLYFQAEFDWDLTTG